MPAERLRSLEADMEKTREESTEANDTYQEVQSSYYSLGSEITRIEQNIEYQGQRKQQLELDLGEIKQSLQHGGIILYNEYSTLFHCTTPLAAFQNQRRDIRQEGRKKTRSSYPPK